MLTVPMAIVSLNWVCCISISADFGFTAKTPDVYLLLWPKDISLPHNSTPEW
jgi:hypothetical protein